jgi:single-stranded-DNA-specific exonuclease
VPAAQIPKKTWSLAPADESAAHALTQSAGVSIVLARLLLARGVTDADSARRFLEPDLHRDWRAPSALPGLDACADAVAHAVREKLKMAVFGDFDADGITATALLTLGLRELGAEAEPVVPHRLNDGYGLSSSVVERLVQMGAGLVITVDCGISTNPTVRYRRGSR